MACDVERERAWCRVRLVAAERWAVMPDRQSFDSGYDAGGAVALEYMRDVICPGVMLLHAEDCRAEHYAYGTDGFRAGECTCDLAGRQATLKDMLVLLGEKLSPR